MFDPLARLGLRLLLKQRPVYEQLAEGKVLAVEDIDTSEADGPTRDPNLRRYRETLAGKTYDTPVLLEQAQRLALGGGDEPGAQAGDSGGSDGRLIMR